MTEIIFHTIPRGVFELTAGTALFGAILYFCASKSEKNDGFRISVLFFLLVVIGWRVGFKIISARYASVLVIPVIFFTAYLFRRLMPWQFPVARLRLNPDLYSFSIGLLFFILLAVCAAKNFRTDANAGKLLEMSALLRQEIQTREAAGKTVVLKDYSNQSIRIAYYSDFAWEKMMRHLGKNFGKGDFSRDITDDLLWHLFQNQAENKAMYFTFIGEEKGLPDLTRIPFGLRENITVLYDQPGSGNGKRRLMLLRYLPVYIPNPLEAQAVGNFRVPCGNLLENGDFERTAPTSALAVRLHRNAPDQYPAVMTLPDAWYLSQDSSGKDVPLLELIPAPGAIDGKYSFRLKSRNENKSQVYNSTYFGPGRYSVQALVRVEKETSFRWILYHYNANGAFLGSNALPPQKIPRAGLYRIHCNFEIAAKKVSLVPPSNIVTAKALLAFSLPKGDEIVIDNIVLEAKQ